MTLRDEIRQTRPFAGPEQEAQLSIERTAASLSHALAEVLRPHGLTAAQYNVLRILRGAGEAGHCRSEVGDRLVTPVPDVTRLLDRLEAAGLIARARGTEDRRQVRARITADGLARLDALDAPVDRLHRDLLGHLGEERLRALIDLLAVARERP